MKIIRTIYLFLLCAGLATLCHAQGKERKTIIEGYIPQAKDAAVRVELNVEYPEDFTKAKGYFKTNTVNGKFRFDIDLTTIRTCSVTFNDDRCLLSLPWDAKLFIQPGDSLNFIVKNLEDNCETTEIYGTNTAACEFLKELRSTGYREYKRYGDTVKDKDLADPEWNLKIAKAISDNYLKILEKYKSKITGEMYKILYANGIIVGYANRIEYIAKLADPNVPFYKEFKEKQLNLDSLYNSLDDMKLALGSRVDYSLMERSILALKMVTSYRSSKNLMYLNQHLDEFFEFLNKETVGKSNRDFILSKFCTDFLFQTGLSNGLDKVFPSFLAALTPRSPYYPELKVLYNKSLNNVKGNVIPNFSFKDIHNNNVHLKQLKGNVVLFDFWYTGCSNCIDIQPHIKEIEERFKNNFVVVSISIDKNPLLWKKGIGLYSSKNAIQLYTSGQGTAHPMVKYYNFDAYPVLILMGKDGKLVVPFTERLDPRDPKNKEILIAEIQKQISK